MQVTASEVEGLPRIRDVYYHDPAAPPAAVVVPSVFVAVHDQDDRLLMVQRCDSGDWELPGGRVDVGESAVAAAQREVAEETGVVVHVTGLIGYYTDPGFIVRSVSGEVPPFVVLFRAVPCSVGRERIGGRRAPPPGSLRRPRTRCRCRRPCGRRDSDAIARRCSPHQD